VVQRTSDNVDIALIWLIENLVMNGSINNLEDAVVREFECVRDLRVPGSIDRYDKAKNRQRQLFRQFFKSHRTRLLSQDKAQLDLIDKQTVDARRTIIRIARKHSIALQQMALGLSPEQPDKARGAGLGKEAACDDCQTRYPHLIRPLRAFGALSGDAW
jgi:hypothetical protein